MKQAALVVLVACGSAPIPTPPPPTEPPATHDAAVAVHAARPPMQLSGEVIVVRASGAASRRPASARALRRIVAARQGAVELAQGYGEVGLTIEAIISGTLDDPSYDTRPVGTNHLPVVLVDEAAYAAGADMAGFAGLWRLTKLADGTLVASAIEDTPYAPALVAGRRAMISRARKALRSPLPDQRIAGLDILDKHAFYELVPDVIALLGDERHSGGAPGGQMEPRVVGEVAAERLRALMMPLVEERLPGDDQPDAWAQLWRDLTSAVARVPAVTPTTSTVIATLPMNQSWPQIAATPRGFLLGVSRLQTPLHGQLDGLVLLEQAPIWLEPEAVEALDVVTGPAGTGVLFAKQSDAWRFEVLPSTAAAASRRGDVQGTRPYATHAALAAAATGYLVVGIDAKGLLALPLDATGKPRGTTRRLALPSPPDSSYHRGIHPVAVARHPAGWLVPVSTRDGLVVVALDDQLKIASTSKVGTFGALTQPKIAIANDRAFLAITASNGANHLITTIVDLAGKPLRKPLAIGAEVEIVSQPLVLDDAGFAAAWIEASNEVHVGRWNAGGDLVANVVIQDREAAPFALSLSRDKDALVIAYEDTLRYPWTIVAKRLELSALK